MHHHFIAILTLGLLVFSTGGIIAPPLSEFTKPNEDLTSPVMNNSHLNPDKLNLPDFNEMHPTGDNSDSIEPVNEGADSPSNTIFDRRYRKSPFQSFDNQIAKKYLQHDIDNAKKHFQMARTDRFIIQFDSMSAVRSNYRALQNQIYTEVRPFVSLPFMTISTINEHVFDLLYDLSGVERVYVDSYAQVLDLEDWEQNILAKRTVNPKPMWYSSESLTGATTLHNLKLNGSGVKIAIIDTGIDKTHPDLDDLDNDPTTNDPKVIAEASFVDYDEDGLPDESPEDTTYHGTHVAGIAAGNGIQIGMAPGAWLMNAKAIDVGGGAYVSWILEAIDWAIVNEADIISMSFAWVMEIQTLLNEAVEEAWDQGVVVVIAIGNSGTQPNAVSSPAISRKTISVGSTTSYDTVAPFSSWGLSLIGTIDPDISAPGVDIFSTVPGGGYAVSSGTSMATPHVSGAAALLLQAFKEKNPTPDQIKFALLKTADDLGESPLHQGTGRLNVSRAYEEWTSLSTALLFPNTKSTPLQFYATPNETISFQAYVLANQSGTYNLQVSGVLASNISLSSSSVTGLGHHFVSVEIAISTGAVGGVYNGTIELTNGARIIFSPLDALDITVLVVEAQNDASSGRDGGEILDTAISVPLGTYEGNLNQTTDDRDLYKLTLSAMVNITAYLSMHDYGSSDYDLLLINENGSLLQYSGHLYSVPEIISFQADYTGTYYLMVMNFGGAGLYSLEINETTISDSVISTGEILGSYTTFTVDSDNDGLINALIISFQVFVSHDGMYDIVGHLAQNRSNWEFGKYVFSSVEEFLELKAGINQVNLTFMGEACFGQFFNGSYLLDYVFLGKSTTLKIMDECVRPYWTPTFNYTDFETPIVYFDASSWNETAIDEDNNGKAEALILSIDMVITAFTEPSNYRVGIPLLLTTTNLTSQISVQFEELFENLYGPTRRTASFSVALDWLLDARTFTGTFIIPTIEYDSFPESYNVPWSYLLWYQSEFRSPSAIEPVIEIEFTDRGVDTDSNGKYDFLNITAHLTSHQTSNFIFIMVGDTLFSFPDQRAILPYSSIAYTTVLLQPGQSRNVSISYIGTNIHANKLNGSYIIPTIFISYNDTSPGSNSVHNSKFIYGFNTSAYNWTDFDPVPVRYENNWVEEAIDEDNNGKLDAIQLNFTVTVVDPGKYTFEIIIVDDLTFGEQVAHVEYLLKEFNASGDYIISTIIDGDVFWANKYQGRLSLKRLGIINGHYISLPYSSQTPDYLAIHSDAAFTKVYSWKDFLDAVPFYFTDFFVKGVNTDSDSKFEELELTIEYHGKSHASVIAELGLFPKVIIEEMEHAASMTTLYFYSGSLYAEVYVQPGIFSDGYYNISLTFTAQDVYLYLYTDTWIINIRAGQYDTVVAQIQGINRLNFDYTPPVRLKNVTQTNGLDVDSDGSPEYFSFSVDTELPNNKSGDYLLYFLVVMKFSKFSLFTPFTTIITLDQNTSSVTMYIGAYYLAAFNLLTRRTEKPIDLNLLYAAVYPVEFNPDDPSSISLFLILNEPEESMIVNKLFDNTNEYMYSKPAMFVRSLFGVSVFTFLSYDIVEVDEDQDGSKDYLDFVVDVYVMKPVTVVLVLEVTCQQADFNSTKIEFHLYDKFTLTPGTHSLNLSIDGATIKANQLDGQIYIDEGYLYDYLGFNILDFAFGQYYIGSTALDIDWHDYLPPTTTSTTPTSSKPPTATPGLMWNSSIWGLVLVSLFLIFQQRMKKIKKKRRQMD